jgi:GTP-binding protein HflX
VLNKADKLGAPERAALAKEFPTALVLSSRDASDVRALWERIVAHFEGDMEEAELFVPFRQQRHVALLHEQARVLEERYDENGTHVRVRAPASVLGGLRRTLGGSSE